MNLFTNLVLFLSLLAMHATPALASFYVYKGTHETRHGKLDAWYVSQNADTNCDNAWKRGVLLEKKDVSGDKYGVACNGNGCQDIFKAVEIERLEINGGPGSVGHLTYYKSRDHALVDLKDNWKGKCAPLQEDQVREHEFNCDYPNAFPTEKRRLGNTVLWCETDVW